MKTNLKKTNIQGMAIVPDDTVNAVKIIGATLNNDPKSLLLIIEDSKSSDTVKFCALSGLFYLLAQNGEMKDTLKSSFRSSETEKLSELFTLFSDILEKKEWDKYPVAVLPESNISREDFLGDSFDKIFGKLLFDNFNEEASSWDKHDSFARPRIIQLIFKIVVENQIIDSKKFLSKSVIDQTCRVLDQIYRIYFSNAKSKIWESRRAAREYFLRKIILFNNILPQKSRDVVAKRWQAWFILEDHYKETSKKVDRKILINEMKEILSKI